MVDFKSIIANNEVRVMNKKIIFPLTIIRAYPIFCVNDRISLERNPFFSKLNGKLV